MHTVFNLVNRRFGSPKELLYVFHDVFIFVRNGSDPGIPLGTLHAIHSGRGWWLYLIEKSRAKIARILFKDLSLQVTEILCSAARREDEPGGSYGVPLDFLSGQWLERGEPHRMKTQTIPGSHCSTEQNACPTYWARLIPIGAYTVHVRVYIRAVGKSLMYQRYIEWK